MTHGHEREFSNFHAMLLYRKGGGHDDVCQFKYLCILGTKSNDIEHPDYVPSINMGYSSESDRCIGM